MPQVTLIEVVQSYFNATDGWSVNSISDTAEGEQVALIAKEVFHEVVTDITDWKFTQKLLQLDSLADLTKPNYLVIPDNLNRIKHSTINYDSRTGVAGSSTIAYKEIQYLAPEVFMERLNQVSTNTANTQIVTDFSGVRFVIKNNHHPTCCTSIDDKYLIFDSYNSDVEDTLHSNNSQVIGYVEKTFNLTDNYVIDLPDHFIPNYLSLVKARASEYLRQEPLFTDARRGNAGLIKYRKNHQKLGVTGRNPSRGKYGR